MKITSFTLSCERIALIFLPPIFLENKFLCINTDIRHIDEFLLNVLYKLETEITRLTRISFEYGVFAAIFTMIQATS